MDSRPQGFRRERTANYNTGGNNNDSNNNNNNNSGYSSGHPRSSGGGPNPRRGGNRGTGRGRSNFHSDRNAPRESYSNNYSSNRPTFDRGTRARPRGTFAKNSRFRARDNEPTDSWYLVEIPHGETGGKEALLRSLNASLDSQLNPINYRVDGNMVSFNIEGQEMADTLKRLSKRITKADGYKIIINVKPSPPPPSTVDEATTELIKQAMSTRFQVSTNHLDLSKFRKDDLFVQRELYVSLDRLPVIQAVVKIIQENIPKLASLNLSDNKIRYLKSLSPLKDACLGLKFLDLSNNSIQNLTEIDNLNGLHLEELSLTGNPAANVKNTSTFISILRKSLPELKKLDGQELPATIGFDVGNPVTHLPATLGNHVPENVAPVLTEFLQKYYAAFDSDDRKPLMDLYHDQAVFSYSCFNSNTMSRDLIHESRNLLKISDAEHMRKLLKRGNLNIVAALTSFCKTQHIKESLTLDVSFSSPEIISLLITGLYIEPSQRQRTIRAFSRTFNLVPDPKSGCVIINDVWVISNSSYDQRQKAREFTGGNSSTSSMRDDEMASEAFASGDSSNPVSREESLVKRLSDVTGMNKNYSRQCLSEVKYDYDQAYQIFLQVNALGSIPPEAFN